MSEQPRHLTIGTRSSELALRQARQVDAMLRAAWPGLDVRTRLYVSSGDERLDVPADQLAPDAFVDRLERALLAGEVDAVVHSYKDLPAVATAGLVIAAVPVRADPREALVARDGHRLADLPAGAVVGTSSARRSAWLRALRPDLEARPIRGPVDSRVRQVMDGHFDAALLAAAGLERLDLAHHITEYFDLDVLPPAAAQGALAVQCRASDAATSMLLAAIDDRALHAAVRAERELEAGARAG
jgi:hydroxymethylbilane synthase